MLVMQPSKSVNRPRRKNTVVLNITVVRSARFTPTALRYEGWLSYCNDRHIAGRFGDAPRGRGG